MHFLMDQFQRLLQRRGFLNLGKTPFTPNLVKGTGLADLGKRKQEVAILSGYLPSTLLEVCFINNSYEMNQYQNRKDFIAKQIAFGIVSR